ncbi:hypothetical protein [Streptomyces sp. NPDC053048]|uniref:hypothetical protein n=1 Tax=Streptomyces sp. NPDC053048 TaxID=3365694 RepID=UPI0037D5983E
MNGPRRRARTYGAVLAGTLLAATTACGTVAERRDDARAAADRFEQALEARQRAVMCAELAPGTREELEESAKTPCDRALEDEDLPAAGPVRHIDVYGDQARAVLAHDTLFLAHFTDGWKVTAAGCRPRGEQPYRCALKGG